MVAAVEEFTRLQREIFPNFQLGLLHGRLRAEEKDAVMTLFRDREVNILVSTSVIEVGVDIPNATVMMVEAANRFGLAQLHQFRGRVGRGQDRAYCILIAESPDAVENERLNAMVETQNGFILAERDLQQRGPGDFLGTRQAGFKSELRIASLTDVHLIEQARNQAHQIFVQDPKLELPEHLPLAETLAHFWGKVKEIRVDRCALFQVPLTQSTMVISILPSVLQDCLRGHRRRIRSSEIIGFHPKNASHLPNGLFRIFKTSVSRVIEG
jgi:ATP-dependent DNA helicase RecG